MSEKTGESRHATIQLQGYIFEKLSFSYDGDSGDEEENEIIGAVPTRFRVGIGLNKEDDFNFNGYIRLSCEVNGSNDKRFPVVSATMRGDFIIHPDTSEDQARKLLQVNGVAVMFPFLRAAIANMAMTAGITPMMLPLFDIRKLTTHDE
jgi:preprotein translocase subunit secB